MFVILLAPDVADALVGNRRVDIAHFFAFSSFRILAAYSAFGIDDCDVAGGVGGVGAANLPLRISS
jgi:hypothetical protein